MFISLTRITAPRTRKANGSSGSSWMARVRSASASSSVPSHHALRAMSESASIVRIDPDRLGAVCRSLSRSLPHHRTPCPGGCRISAARVEPDRLGEIFDRPTPPHSICGLRRVGRTKEGLVGRALIAWSQSRMAFQGPPQLATRRRRPYASVSSGRRLMTSSKSAMALSKRLESK